ncbi:hypothetical protein SAMN05421755_100827 [Nitrosomonas sp. Nm33]|nr:hypothetical protein SAMN05421755_100827 [Nitrosomonas sp. Nm33]
MILMVTTKSVSQNEYLIQFIGLRLNKAPRAVSGEVLNALFKLKAFNQLTPQGARN